MRLAHRDRRSVCHDVSFWWLSALCRTSVLRARQAAGVTAAGYLPGGSGQCRRPGPGESDPGAIFDPAASWTLRFMAARPAGPMDVVLELGDEEIRDDGRSGFRADVVALAGEAVQPPAGQRRRGCP